MITYKGKIGEKVSTAAQNAIELAEKHNRKVKLTFNGVNMTVNKRLSVKHVVGTYMKMYESRIEKYKKTPEGLRREKEKEDQRKSDQATVNRLMKNPPKSKFEAMRWIHEFVPAADNINVRYDLDEVLHFLSSLGFNESQHVGRPELRNKTASRLVMAEYVAGQVMYMLREVGACHPIAADWAKTLRD